MNLFLFWLEHRLLVHVVVISVIKFTERNLIFEQSQIVCTLCIHQQSRVLSLTQARFFK